MQRILIVLPSVSTAIAACAAGRDAIADADPLKENIGRLKRERDRLPAQAE